MAGNDTGKRKGLRVIGKPLIKVDAKAKCIGELKYADDLVLPRMLHTKLLRSSVPHDRSRFTAVTASCAVLPSKRTSP